MTKNELKQLIRECLREELSTRKLTESTSNKVYVVFNYYPIKYKSGYDLDNFYLHLVSTNRNEVINRLQEEAVYRVENIAELQNSLVCYYIDPADYDCTVDDFLAAEGKGGHDLHWDFRDVTYALTSIADYSTPLFSQSTADIMFMYDDYIEKNASTLGFDIDDLYANNYNTLDTDIIETLNADPNFKKFITSVITNKTTSI